MTPEIMYSKSREEQAEIIWKELFVNRLPLSEACRGVLTVLNKFGLNDEIVSRDLTKIRAFYNSFKSRGEAGATDFCELAFKISGIRYAIMTNVPFDENEVRCWRPNTKNFSPRFRSALRVDPLLAGNWEELSKVVKLSGYPVSVEGAKQYLRDWCKTINPEYLMASTPKTFAVKEKEDGNKRKRGLTAVLTILSTVRKLLLLKSMPVGPADYFPPSFCGS